MPDAGRTGKWAVPDFGETVCRERLINRYSRARPPFAVIAAPAAYGKSVLASQVARRYASAFWVRVPGGALGPCDLLAAALAATSPDTVCGDAFLTLGAAPAQADLVDRLEEAVAPLAQEGCCLVFDNVDASSARAVADLAAALEGRASPLRVLTTVRCASALSDCPMWVWQLGPRDLLLDDSEAARVACGVLGAEPDNETLNRLLDASGRQVGLLSALARSGATETGDWREFAASQEDILAVLRRLADTQLDAAERRTLRCMALLGEGTADDLRSLPDCPSSGAVLRHIAAAIPVVRVRTGSRGDRFIVHDLAQMVFGTCEPGESDGDPELDAVLRVLAERGDAERLLTLIADRGDVRRLGTWLASDGLAVLKCGSIGVLDRALGAVPPVELVRNPKLLVLKAATDWELGRSEPAVSGARVARELAEQEGDTVLLANALIILAQAALTQADFLLARAYLERALGLCRSTVSAETQVALLGRCILVNAVLGDLGGYSASLELIREYHSRYGLLTEETEILVRFYVSLSEAILLGDWSGAEGSFKAACQSRSVARSTRAAAAYDYCAALLERGRVAHLKSAIDMFACLAGELGNAPLELSLPSMHTMLLLIAGEPEGAVEAMTEGSREAWEAGERLSVVTELFSGSVALAATRRAHDALALAEVAGSYMQHLPVGTLQWLTALARATALLLMDDSAAASRIAREVHGHLHGTPIAYQHLHAELLLSEVDRRSGDTAGATTRLVEHSAYLMSESANWLSAMHMRAFPGLLGVLAAAVGADNIPVHMLRLLPDEYAREAVSEALGVLTDDQHAVVARRTLRSTRCAPSTTGTASQSLAVRLFGGLEVCRPASVVSEREWKKRKARLLFAMLSTRYGKDVPREQIIEYLWPGMDGTTGLNNFYVVWSAMKRALSPHLGRGETSPYVEHRGGVCRVVEEGVSTDLNEFDAQLSVAAKAHAAGDEGAELAALIRVKELYRGELLPGEAYDDWFSALRERCRHDYEDAMLRAAEILNSQGDAKGALMLVRRALENDPWREDLYQAALRLQIASGQRSAAIQTFLTCRSRLVEDLGIDPSAETSGLYQQVLCMDAGANWQESAGQVLGWKSERVPE